MSALSDAAADYLRLRNRLGHDLAEYHRLLPRFVAFLDDACLPTVTIAAALEWANAPEVDPSTTMAARRMTIARGFARHMAGLDPRTEIPPFGLVASRRHRHEPFIFSPADVDALLTGAQSLRTRFASATHHTLIGLLATTGMRVGEAIRLDRSDLDETDAVLTIRESKFGKSRLVPVQPSVLAALHRYARLRDAVHREPTTVSFFVSIRGNRMVYPTIHAVFRNLCDSAEIGTSATCRPRIHDLRHTFAVRTLLGWYRAGEDVDARLPVLSTYLGHRDPRWTYWYLSAAPELLALAARRLESGREVTTR
ncbi:tyrosine-type recombinase/integrase [Kibdelosporangium philippinense]|uniref:Tyrosine-type recombinase/integrase n=1 Tax=Kibdelosporangium philippinense TaxID=211113 RepID=A0ABS8ZAT9_9PSEU|nr:tyrosine-type recombinase/integrase [Kibdelosporangium philippinense]MCE7002035.1 tyrosine-type recombinase/integrase [Kibdelosporangium philippinense]MCE7004522.1 tyrosine-type recombinase/integrase [Kibdelosporangium philippinense]